MSADLPATTWENPNREVEYTVGDANSIVDPDGNNFVDPDGNQVVDTGVTTDYMAATAWEESDLG